MGPESGERWGILGGSFDPVHRGHINLANQVMERCRLDGVLLVPSFNHPFKAAPQATYDQRIEMLQIAVRDHLRLLVSDIEREENLSGYSLDTVRALKRRFKNTELYFIVGEDNVADLPRWHRPDELLSEVPFLVGSRPPHRPLSVPPGLAADRIQMVQTDLMDISSTAVRETLAEGDIEAAAGMIDAGVHEYIIQKGLYR